jgi:Sulfotransferase family
LSYFVTLLHKPIPAKQQGFPNMSNPETVSTAPLLYRETLLETANTQTGLSDFGDIPFLEPLDVLIESMNREARLEGPRFEQARNMILSMLTKRLALVDDRKKYPEIANEVITAPVFIVGAPRTGSTHLHALLATLEGVRSPMFWEMAAPSPPPEAQTYATDARIARVQAMVDLMPEELQKRHPVAANRPEQCNMLMDWSFYNLAWLASYEIPTYRNWLFNADHAPALETHRRTLQHLQWRNPGRWVLKYPKHLLNLDAVLATYPDARLIWTHRDPAVVLPSVCSLTGYMRSSTPGYDPKHFGPEWAALEETVMRRGISVRDNLTGPAGRDLDVHYRDLMRDEMGTVASVCAHLGIPFEPSSRSAVQTWLDDHPKTKHGVHTYAAEDFGLTIAGLHRRFSFYIDRFGIDTDAKA